MSPCRACVFKLPDVYFCGIVEYTSLLRRYSVLDTDVFFFIFHNKLSPITFLFQKMILIYGTFFKLQISYLILSVVKVRHLYTILYVMLNCPICFSFNGFKMCESTTEQINVQW